MASLGKFVHTPVDRKRYIIDYSDWLNSGETLTAASFQSVPNTGTPAVVDANTLTSATVPLFVSGGDDGIQYQILVTVTTSLGQTKQDEFFIRSRAN